MLSKQKKKEAHEVTQKWIREVIIGLNLCPFAKAPFIANRVRIAVVDKTNMKSFLTAFLKELERLDKYPHTETTLMVIPAFGRMTDFQAFFSYCEEMLVLNECQHKYQLVFFHPYARLVGLPPESPKNLTTIAPYPTLHILRVESVEKLGAQLKQDVQKQNDQTLQQLTENQFLKIWSKIME